MTSQSPSSPKEHNEQRSSSHLDQDLIPDELLDEGEKQFTSLSSDQLTDTSHFIRSEDVPYPSIESNDMEICEVDERDCSQAAQERWSQSSKRSPNTPIVIEDGDSPPARIKKESSPNRDRPPVNNQSMLAAQRSLMRDFARRQRQGGVSTLFGPARRAVSRAPSPPRRAHDPSITLGNDLLDEKAELEQLMRRDGADNAWMDQDDHGEQEELDNLKALKNTFRKRAQRTGTLFEADEIENMKVSDRIRTIERRREKANRSNVEQQHYANHQESMFISDGEDHLHIDEDMQPGDDNDIEERRRMYHLEGDTSMARALQEDFWRRDQEANKKTRKPGSAKARKPRAKTARDIEDNRRQKEREKGERRKRKTGKRGPTAKGKAAKGHGKAGNGKTGPKVHKSRMRNRWNDEEDALKQLLENLLNDNPIENRLAQGEYGEAPEIRTSNKKEQLNALIASVPDDYDTHKASANKQDLLKASKRFGHGKVKAQDGKWLLKGMKSPLYHHQLLAADWMVGRELAQQSPYGGLLADAMGLGKTVEMLATMIGNPPSSKDIKEKRKTTLLVVPSSVIKQWMEEIQLHVNENVFPRVIHYKASKEIPMLTLKDCDIVITSYAEVMNSYPFPDIEEMKKVAKKGFDAWVKLCKDITGMLHQITWYRVVLDEAHSIKNFKARTSVACQNLKARYRWALTGTPIHNRLDELFPYFRFLRAEWTKDYAQFKKHFCDPDADDAAARVRVVLSIVMVRRTMKDKILGRPIVELPPIHPTTNFISFSKEEKVLYQLLEERFRQNLNRHFARGTAERNYGVFMVQLLRLRQCVAHPFLLERTIKDIFTIEDVHKQKKKLKSHRQDKTPLYEQVEQWVVATDAERNAARVRGEDVPEPGEPLPFGISDFGTKFRMDKFLDNLDTKKLYEAHICHLCGDLPQNAQITNCGHIFCSECLRNHVHRMAAENKGSDFTECPVCLSVFAEATPFKGIPADEEGDGDEATPTDSPKPRSRHTKAGKVRGSIYQGPKVKDSTWLNMVTKDRVPLLSSTKMIAVKAQVLKWLAESPDDKIIIFTQFRLVAKIIGLIAEKEKWNHVYFLGDMDAIQRHSAVRAFHQDPAIRIMIAGLKCGGQALNLVCANRVISVDLWWNHQIEMQAFARVFRIGQRKETHVTRLRVIKNTIDARLLDMQADKVKIIDEAMQDTGSVVQPLSIEDLASLFGHLREDENGVLRVEADYEQDDDDDAEQDGSTGQADVVMEID